MVVFIIGKDDGGGLPICLLPSPVRVWEGCGRHVLDSWQEAQARPYDWARGGRSSEQAVWRSMLDDSGFTAAFTA